MKLDVAYQYSQDTSHTSKKNFSMKNKADIPFSFNIHQELEMASAFVNCIRDVSSCNDVALHNHNFHEIILVESGELQYLIKDTIYNIHRGHLIYIPAGISHRPILCEEPKENYSRIVLWISIKYLETIFQIWPSLSNHLDSPLSPFVSDISQKKYEHLWKYFETSVIEENIFDEFSDAFLAGNALCLIAKAASARYNHVPTAAVEKKELFSKIISYIEMHYREKITIESVVNYFYISKSSLSKLFQDKLNVSFYNFVTQRRLTEAKVLLQKELSLNEIAEQVGFSDYSNFYRAFKKQYGISPRQYRELFY